MTIEFMLLCILIAKYRQDIAALFEREEEYDIDDYSYLIWDAPKSRRHLRLIK